MNLRYYCSIALLAFSAWASAQERVSQEFSEVIIPEFSLQQTLAGEPVNVDRIDRYERLDREMTTVCYMHSSTSLTLKRANRYFPILEPILKEEGIPVDFLYLAAIESSLNPKAVSPAKAVGIWQIMAGTAREYGLEVNDDVDERYHIEKATRAACKYFKEAYRKFGSWTAVAAAYNAGMNRISTERSRQLENNVLDLWLNDETSRYVFRILAMKAFFSSPKKYGYRLKKSQLYQPVEYTEVKVDTTILNLVDFARSQGITYAQLKEANLWLRSTKLPNKSRKVYYIKIPRKEDLYYTKHKFSAYRKEWVID